MTSRPCSRSCGTASIRSGIAGGLAGELGLLTGPSGMASANTTRLDLWWIEKRWLDDRIVARVGQFAGQYFYGVQHYGSSFIFEPRLCFG